ncbi:MAG TPA: DNA replication and repair protein RecF [Polyangiaceae bacterium]|nr:DNA replication and repair protein RecF [Polyangiaceae bacterium]
MSSTPPEAPDPIAAPLPSLVLEGLSVREFRNLARVDIEPAPRMNVVSGSNGHGKTSLLEAIYFAATSRSFRTHRTGDLIRHGAAVASVKARFTEHKGDLHPLSREQTAAASGRGCVVTLDGNKPQSLAGFATRSPVVVFHPEEMALSTGPASLRRKLLDRVALFINPASADSKARYSHAIRARQELLHRKGATSTSTPTPTPTPTNAEVEAFEALAAKHGAELTRARQRAAEALTVELHAAFRQIAAPELGLEARFQAGGSPDEAEAKETLASQRNRDAHRPSAGFGPHRDDLGLFFDGHPARLVGSQGQHRALTLSIKAAEAAAVAAVRGLEPILLLDDVSSELDPDRTAALFQFLALARGQIFLTTTRPDLIVTPGLDRNTRSDFRIDRGASVALPKPPSSEG